ncbi:MAG TPA: growth inhibitor PemK [Phenylobacterium sp.]|nr:growth inhibitor PemK [Phenylobacterium sp.]
MSLPEPVPGLVIRYSFLWSDAADRGEAEGAKARPCAIVVAAPSPAGGGIRTLVAPVTHAAPRDADASMELPQAVCRALGLDGGRHWIRLDELNRFAWPGYDLRPIPGSDRYAYGMSPRAVFEDMKRRILELAQRRRSRTRSRD